jgi:hypothetical protein
LKKNQKIKLKQINAQHSDFVKLLDVLKSPYNLFVQASTFELKRKILSLVFKRIYVYNKKIHDIEYADAIQNIMANQKVLFSTKWLPLAELFRTKYREDISNLGRLFQCNKEVLQMIRK